MSDVIDFAKHRGKHDDQSAPDEPSWTTENGAFGTVGRIAEMAAEGRIGNFVIVVQDRETGLFLHDLRIDGIDGIVKSFAMIGILQTLIYELTETASMAPTIGADGEIINPFMENAE